MDGDIQRTKSSIGTDTVELVHDLVVPLVWAIIEGIALATGGKWKWLTGERNEGYAKLCLHCVMTLSSPRCCNGAAYAAAARRAGTTKVMVLKLGMWFVRNICKECGYIENECGVCVHASRNEAGR